MKPNQVDPVRQLTAELQKALEDNRQLGKELAEAQGRLAAAKKANDKNFELASEYAKAVRQQAVALEALAKCVGEPGTIITKSVWAVAE